MENKELFQEYKDDVFRLKYKDENHLDRIRRKGKMLIRNVHKDKSEYLTDFNKIRFYPGFAPADEDYQKECWNSGKNKVINLINIMIEEASIFGTVTESNPSKKTRKTQKSNRIFIVHGHDDNTKVNVARFIEKLGL
jgi:hypothetical protein